MECQQELVYALSSIECGIFSDPEFLETTQFSTFYSARNARIASAVLATAIPSVRLSVRLSVTRRYCVKTTARSTVQFALSGIAKCV